MFWRWYSWIRCLPFSNGHRHECSWHDGLKQGYGKDTLQNGDSNCGEQDSGSLNKSLPPLADAVLQANLGCKKGQLKMQFTFAESTKGLEVELQLQLELPPR